MHIKSVRFGLSMGFAFAVFYWLFALLVRFAPDVATKMGKQVFHSLLVDPTMPISDYVMGSVHMFICGLILGFLIMFFYNLLVCCRKQECCSSNGKQ